MERKFDVRWCKKCEGRLWHIVAHYNDVTKEIEDLDKPYWKCQECDNEEYHS